MKLSCTQRHRSRAFILKMCLGFFITQLIFSAAIAAGNSNYINEKDEPAKKIKSRNITYSSRNNSSVKLYPDALKKTVHVIARKNYGRSIDFFVFDMEGTLMENYRMKSRDHKKISGLKKGAYVFRVFCGDEETASGNFEIR